MVSRYPEGYSLPWYVGPASTAGIPGVRVVVDRADVSGGRALLGVLGRAFGAVAIARRADRAS